MARPTKLEPETEHRILVALRAGNTRKVAAGYGRIDESTLERGCGVMRVPRVASNSPKQEAWHMCRAYESGFGGQVRRTAHACRVRAGARGAANCKHKSRRSDVRLDERWMRYSLSSGTRWG